ncbi:MAG: DUF6502 family protein [Oleiphilus sp.]
MSNLSKQIVKGVMKPLIRLILSLGVNYKDFCDIAKVLFVEVASEDYGIRGRPTNNSRVALLTGLDRKQVKAVKDQLADLEPLEVSSVGQMSRVLSAWYQDPDFSDANNTPLPLSEKDDSGFTLLAKKYGGDIPAGAILKELMRTNSVKRLDTGELVAVSRVYNPAGDKNASLERGASVIKDLCETLCHNIFDSKEEETRRFERRTMNINIAWDRVADFKRFIDQKGQAFLEDVDAWLSNNELAETDRHEAIRLGVGLYSFESAVV